ncbi:MAG TPA: Nramp family divalent metal transporter [Vicinamibacteria bacterium]|nr:Nramp family divalent metal transporter [Vicinamibacteria bacterium]
MSDAPGILEPPRAFWGILRSIGPGLILTANIVGTGELIVTTRLGSRVGFDLLWFIVLGCFIKVFVQVELGRYTVSEGVGSLEILDRLPGPRRRVSWAVWFWMLMYVGTLCQMAAMIGGIAELFAGSASPGAYAAWVIACAALTAIMLAVGRYGLVERLSTFMVVGFTLSSILAVGFLQGTASRVSGSDLVRGLSLGLPADLVTAFAAFGITGVGAAELMFYPIWCLEKGYARAVGPRDGSPQWEARARGWLRVMRWDAWLSMAVYTVGTVCFYLLGAAILNRQGRVVDDLQPMTTLSEMYTQTYGPAQGWWIFFVGAFTVLYSTYFVSAASNARLFADAGGLLGVFRSARPADRARIIRFAVVGIPVFTAALILLAGPRITTLILVGGTAQALMLPFLGFAALWFGRRVAPSIRGGGAWTAALVVAFVLMSSLGLFQAQSETARLWNRLFPATSQR